MNISGKKNYLEIRKTAATNTQYLRRWNFLYLYIETTKHRNCYTTLYFFHSLSIWIIRCSSTTALLYNNSNFFLYVFSTEQSWIFSVETIYVNFSNEQTNRELKYRIQRPKLDWRQAHQCRSALTPILCSSFAQFRFDAAGVCHNSPHSLAPHRHIPTRKHAHRPINTDGICIQNKNQMRGSGKRNEITEQQESQSVLGLLSSARYDSTAKEIRVKFLFDALNGCNLGK